jgi:heme-degrading monooxygenase HmoA
MSSPDQAREYAVMASRLPLARYRDLPGFLRATMLIRTQLIGARGLIGYALDAHLTRKTFWTVSVWDSRDALDTFSRADPHRSRVRVIRPPDAAHHVHVLDRARRGPARLLGRGPAPSCRRGAHRRFTVTDRLCICAGNALGW